MANRAMAAKVMRAKREGREAYWMEASKHTYITHVDHIPAYDEAMVQRATKVAKPEPKAREMVAWSKPVTVANKTAAQSAWVMDSGCGLIRRHK